MKITNKLIKSLIKEAMEENFRDSPEEKEMMGKMSNKEFSDYVTRDRHTVPNLKGDMGPVDGMEGPYQYKSGAVLYYDPKAGKYYDRRRDIYIDNEEASQLTTENRMEDEGTPIPPEELHDALSGAIYDLYKYVNGVRPRWMKFSEMSIEELEKMHDSLTAELEQQAKEEEAQKWHSRMEDPNQELEDRYISDHDAYEAEAKRMMTPEEGEGTPSRMGMERFHQSEFARSQARQLLDKDRLREMIREEYNKTLVENVTNIKFTDDELATLCAALTGYDESFYDSTAFEKLFEYYTSIPQEEGGMPYGTAKAKTGDPYVWILDRLTPEMIGGCAEAGDMTFLEENEELYKDSMVSSWIKFVIRNPEQDELLLRLWGAMIGGTPYQEVVAMATEALGYKPKMGSFGSPIMPDRGSEEDYLMGIMSGIKFHARKVKPDVEYPTSEEVAAEVERVRTRPRQPRRPVPKKPYGGGTRNRPWDRST